jgi:hypothetical protein
MKNVSDQRKMNALAMPGFSAGNLKYTRTFSESWPKRATVQASLAQRTMRNR